LPATRRRLPCCLVTPDFRETVLSGEGGSPLLRHFALQQPEKRRDRQRRIEPNGFLERYQSAPAVQRQPLLLAYLNQAIGAVVRRPLSASEANEPLRRMGMDSLMAMEIKSRLEGDLRIELALARLIEGPSIRELSSLVSEQLATIVPGDAFEQEHLQRPDLGNLVEGEL
jgi:acyl carrier protein